MFVVLLITNIAALPSGDSLYIPSKIHAVKLRIAHDGGHIRSCCDGGSAEESLGCRFDSIHLCADGKIRVGIINGSACCRDGSLQCLLRCGTGCDAFGSLQCLDTCYLCLKLRLHPCQFAHVGDVVVTSFEIISGRPFRDGEENRMVQVTALKQLRMLASWCTNRHYNMPQFGYAAKYIVHIAGTESGREYNLLQIRTFSKDVATNISRSFLKSDGCQVGAISKRIIFYSSHRTWYHHFSQACSLKRSVGYCCYTIRNDNRGKIAALVECILSDGSYPCEVLQLIERCDGFVPLEHLAEAGHGGSLIFVQFTIFVRVPVGHAERLHVGVSKIDVVPLYFGRIHGRELQDVDGGGPPFPLDGMQAHHAVAVLPDGLEVIHDDAVLCTHHILIICTVDLQPCGTLPFLCAIFRLWVIDAVEEQTRHAVGGGDGQIVPLREVCKLIWIHAPITVNVVLVLAEIEYA